ncbi:hypothetical protein DFH05DRAFT_1611575, partial [Lentinula detonsa]
KNASKVHPAVLSRLLHLRLKSELGVRASESKADKTDKGAQTRSKGKDAARRAKGISSDQPHLSKKPRKALKEKKEIVREFRDAEAVIDQEERASTHMENFEIAIRSLFRNSNPTPLLPAALEGIIKYAHLVNIDFFQDLMKVLRGLILSHSNDQREEANPEMIVTSLYDIGCCSARVHMHWPTAVVVPTLQFVQGLVVKDPRLQLQALHDDLRDHKR